MAISVSGFVLAGVVLLLWVVSSSGSEANQAAVDYSQWLAGYRRGKRHGWEKAKAEEDARGESTRQYYRGVRRGYLVGYDDGYRDATGDVLGQCNHAREFESSN